MNVEFQTVVHEHGPRELDSFDAKIQELMSQGWTLSFQPFVFSGMLCQQLTRYPQADLSKFGLDFPESDLNIDHDKATAALAEMRAGRSPVNPTYSDIQA